MSGVMQLVAELMSVAAKTAPKSLGQDYVDIQVVAGEQLQLLADEMEKFGQSSGKINFDRDAASIRNADAVVFVALRENKPLGLNCGACGHDRCVDLETREGSEFVGPLCAWRLLDVGIALGSAAKMASTMNVDSRVMYRPAVVARKIGMVSGDILAAIPIAATSKNIFFDREPGPKK